MSVRGVVTWVVGGACAGVCVMVAAPVLAPIGAVTAAGALIGAGVGGSVGGFIGSIQESVDGNIQKVRTKHSQDAEVKSAEYTILIEKLKERLRHEAAKRQPYQQFVIFVEVFSAIGFSIAANNGAVVDTLRQTVEEYVVGSASRALPPDLTQRLAALAASPPSFNQALYYYAQLDPSFSDAGLLDVVGDLIAVIYGSPFAAASVAAWDTAWRHRRGETVARNAERGEAAPSNRQFAAF